MGSILLYQSFKLFSRVREHDIGIGKGFLRQNLIYGHLSANPFICLNFSQNPHGHPNAALQCWTKQQNKNPKPPSIIPALSQVIHISIHMAFALSHLWKLSYFSLWQAVIVASNTFLFQCWEIFHYLLYQKNCFLQYITQMPKWKNATCLL